MKNTKSIIEAENISLTYHISQSFSLKKVFTKTELDKEKYTVHAVKDVSFTLDKSQNLGIVGSNGSGKSTLLRMLSKTYAPDSGKLLVNTLSTQLLTLGAGFFNELTGRDNLYLNALLLGIPKDDLDNGLVEEILEFSELGKFIELPMYTYSSGMKSRLTFSVAACIRPDLPPICLQNLCRLLFSFSIIFT
jgi:ABC-type polysaccharide/polyol phosphate transport system ATPase subunit